MVSHYPSTIRLLFTLESNACQSGFLSAKQDLSVVHCQLLIFIFHHFTKDTRTSLFKACVTSVIRAAQARRWEVADGWAGAWDVERCSSVMLWWERL